MKKTLILMLLILLSPPAAAQILGCDKNSGALGSMSREKLTEAYCSADAAMASAMSGVTIDDERAADMQRQCLDERQKIADLLKRRFNLEPPACRPLIEGSKK